MELFKRLLCKVGDTLHTLSLNFIDAVQAMKFMDSFQSPANLECLYVNITDCALHPRTDRPGFAGVDEWYTFVQKVNAKKACAKIRFEHINVPILDAVQKVYKVRSIGIEGTDGD